MGEINVTQQAIGLNPDAHPLKSAPCGAGRNMRTGAARNQKEAESWIYRTIKLRVGGTSLIYPEKR